MICFSLGSDGWKLKFVQNHRKVLELYFKRDDKKCDAWFNAIQQIKTKQKEIKKAKEVTTTLGDSWKPLIGIEEEKNYTPTVK